MKFMTLLFLLFSLNSFAESYNPELIGEIEVNEEGTIFTIKASEGQMTLALDFDIQTYYIYSTDANAKALCQYFAEEDDVVSLMSYSSSTKFTQRIVYEIDESIRPTLDEETKEMITVKDQKVISEVDCQIL